MPLIGQKGSVGQERGAGRRPIPNQRGVRPLEGGEGGFQGASESPEGAKKRRPRAEGAPSRLAAEGASKAAQANLRIRLRPNLEAASGQLEGAAEVGLERGWR